MDPGKVCLFIPPGLKKFKLDLFERIGRKIVAAGGILARKIEELSALDDSVVPIVGCTPELRELIASWRARHRTWIYWDRGYMRRVFATWLPRGENGGYYRWHLNSFQLQKIEDFPDDRWLSMKTTLSPWKVNKEGHIVVAMPTPTYERFHAIQGWTEKTLRALALCTTRQVVVRDKESKRPLQSDLDGAYCLVAHGSMAAVEAVICGCPVVVHPDSAAALMGLTDLAMLDKVRYPDREPWVRALAYNQFNETELVDGTLWRLIR